MYHPAKFHRPMPTNIGNIRYQKSCGQTNRKKSGKQTNKYATCQDWHNPHMLIAITASSGQFVTQASRLPGQFVAPG